MLPENTGTTEVDTSTTAAEPSAADQAAADAEFAAAFDAEAGKIAKEQGHVAEVTPPAPEQDPAAAAEKATADEAAAADAAKPKKLTKEEEVEQFLATATPEQLRQHYKDTRLRLSGQSQAIEADRSTIAGLKQELETLRAAAGKPAAPAEGATAPKTPDPAGTSDADPVAMLLGDQFGELDELYPEVAKPIREMAARIASRLTEDGKTLAEIRTERATASANAQAELLLAAHKDFPILRDTPEFLKWRAEAPAFIKAGLARNEASIVDGAEAARLTQIFKLETGWKAPAATPDPAPGKATPPPGKKETQATRREIQLDSADSHGSKGPGPTQGTPDEFEAAFNMEVKKIEKKSAAEGRL